MSFSEKNRRLIEVNAEIVKLKREKKKLEGDLKYMFDDERDYLTTKIPDFHSSDDEGHKWINRQYAPLWAGIRNAACFQTFHTNRIPKEATDEDIANMKVEIRKLIDQLVIAKTIIEKEN